MKDYGRWTIKKGGRRDLLAHVLAVQEGTARDTFETPNVPLLVQGNQGLPFNDLFPAAGTICHKRKIKDRGRRIK